MASFNASLNRSVEGGLVSDLATGTDSQAAAVAEILQKTDADIVLINEFDYDAAGAAAEIFQDNYLSVSQNGAAPIEYPYVYAAPSNTGILSGFDLNGDGTIATPSDLGGFTYANDSQGFGQFPGQFGFVIFSKYPIDESNIRTFQNFLWKDMPGNLLTDGSGTVPLNTFYSAEEIGALRLSSKNHVDVPVLVNGEVVHVLAAHPTPPVFDGEEDRNGKRNHDEIRFWSDYVEGAAYIYDDNGNKGGLAADARFVIVGDYNADPFDGDSVNGAINQLLDNPAITASATDASVTPSGEGSVEVGPTGFNATHIGNPAFDTADFGFNASNPAEDVSPGNLRVDYVLPSASGLDYVDGGVFWPTSSDADFALTSFPTSDHRLVYADLNIKPTGDNTVKDFEFIGEIAIADDADAGGTRVGGLSGIAYDTKTKRLVAVSDDRDGGADGSPRLYILDVDLSDGTLDDGDISVRENVLLKLQDGTTLDAINPDPEGIALRQGKFIISSERDLDGNPAIYIFDGETLVGEIAVDPKYLPDAAGTQGVRNNLGFESLTLSPNGKTLYVATESALIQDGEPASLTAGSNARVIAYDVASGTPVAEYFYPVEPIANAPVPSDAFADSGLVELLALDNSGNLLALERSFSIGAPDKGYTGKIFLISLEGEDNVLAASGAPVEKKLLVDLKADFGIIPDNIEGMTLGPILPNGQQSLIIVSDDNFDAFGPQDNQVLAFGIDVAGIIAGDDDGDNGGDGGDGGDGSTTLDPTVAEVFDSGVGSDGAEVVSFYNGKAYVTNGESDTVDVFTPGNPVPNSIDVSTLPGYDGVNSVAAGPAGIAVAIETANAEQASPSMLNGENGWGAVPIFTVGASLDNGYTPPGIMDGIGAIELDANTVRFFVNHELVSSEGYEFDVDGITLTGARISYFDVDKTTKSIVDGGQAITTIYDGNGNRATDTSFTFEDNAGFMRFCSGSVFEANMFGGNNGLVDTIYFAGEETGGDFSGVGGGEWALDVDTGEIWALPAFGRGAWENVTQVNTGTDTHVAFILADDTSPFDADNDGEDEGAPMYLYVGEKDPSGNFLGRNGLEDGKLYVWVADDGSLDPRDWAGTGSKTIGSWVEIDNSATGTPSEDGSTGFDEYGRPTQSTLWTRAEQLGAFQFSRPEDVATNPHDGWEFTMASTGRSSDFEGADRVGTIYTFDMDFTDIDHPGAIGRILYDGDDDPTQALRSPDNLDWADNGKIYVQEDRAVGDIFAADAANPNDASIVELDPHTGKVTRVAEIDQSVHLPFGAVEENFFANGVKDNGDWESSGILDVSTLFGEAPGTLLIANVQAHGLDDQNRFDVTGPGAQITDDNLKEGGQLLFLTAPGTSINVTDPVDPVYAQNGLVALYNEDGTLKTTYEVGNLPDMVTYSEDGKTLYVANEGENQGDQDPAGSISIIDTTTGEVQTIGFEYFDDKAAELQAKGVRIFPGETPSTDFEPEYITEGPNGKLYVSLQEANAIAVLDIATLSWDDIFALGTVDHSVPGQGIDASDRDDAINIATHPVQGLRMPDAIVATEIGGMTYILTANEGDARDQDSRIEDITLDPTAFPNAPALQDETVLGRLEISLIDGDTDGDGDYDELYSYGSRSFTIYDDQGNVVFDSGDQFEQIIAANRPANAFNNQDFPSDALDVVDENRSDNKGPEPEAIEVGTINGDTFAFIGLERDSGIMIYDISDPANASFVDYIEGGSNISPEIIDFIPAAESTSGKDQIAVSYEVSGTTVLYDLDMI